MVLDGSERMPGLPLSSGAVLQIAFRETVLLPECKHLVAQFDIETWLPANPTTDAIQSLSIRKIVGGLFWIDNCDCRRPSLLCNDSQRPKVVTQKILHI